MKTYKITINRQNFLLKINNQIEKKGFYATRIVKTKSIQEAEKLATEMILSDTYLNSAIKNVTGNSPRLFIEEIEEINQVFNKDDINEINRNYMFYPEEDD